MRIRDLLSARFPAPSPSARQAAEKRQSILTKPPGSLGALERLAIHVAEQSGEFTPTARPAATVLFAADHPVTTQNISPYPPEVTAAMLSNFASGGAAASVLTRHLNMPLVVVDVGVNGGGEQRRSPANKAAVQYVHAKRSGVVGDLVHTDAMDLEACVTALEAGQTAVANLSPQPRWLILGEMGIGNTTVAAALSAALLGGTAEDWVGPGTGATPEILANKRRVVEDALRRVGPVPAETALQKLGGREITAMVGAAHAAASRGISILVDGYIVTAAMLCLTRITPEARRFMYFAHRSAEPGHRRQLEALEATPLLELGLRLGEGSGALAAFGLVETALALHAHMATFEEADVPDRDEP